MCKIYKALNKHHYHITSYQVIAIFLRGHHLLQINTASWSEMAAYRMIISVKLLSHKNRNERTTLNCTRNRTKPKGLIDPMYAIDLHSHKLF